MVELINPVTGIAVCVQAAQKDSEARRAKIDELRRTSSVRRSEAN